MNLLNKMWKYKFHYVIMLLALPVLIVFKGIPLISAILISFRDFMPSRGITESPWVGMENYTELLGSAIFTNAIGNTLTLKLLYILLCGILALLLTLSISSIRSNKLQQMIQTIILIPYFIPTIVLMYIMALLVSVDYSPIFNIDTLLFADPTWWTMIVISIKTFSTVGIPVIIALAAIHASSADILSSKILPAVRAILAFMLIQLSTVLSFDLELVYSLSSGFVMHIAETINLLEFRVGYHFADFSQSSALFVIKFIIQLIMTILVYLLIRRWFKGDLFHRETSRKSNQTFARKSYIGPVFAILYSMIVLTILYFLFVYPFLGTSGNQTEIINPLLAESYILSMSFILFIVFIYIVFTVMLAYPLTVKDLPGRTLYKGFLLILLTVSPFGVHEYMMLRDFGLVNTIAAPAFSGIVSIIGVFVLKSIFNSKYSHLKEEASLSGRGEMYTFFMLFIPRVWKPLIALGVIHFVSIWNNYLPTLVYITDPQLYTPTGSFYFHMMTGVRDSGITPEMILKLGLVISLPSIILFLIFRKWLTSEVFVGEARK